MSTPAMPVPAPSAESSPALSEGERLINVFIAPSKTFTDLKRKASWFVPWLLLAVVSYAFIGAVAQKVGLRQATENQMRLNTKAQERMAQMPAEQRERGMEISVMVTKVILFFVPLIALLIYLIIAAVLMGSFNFGLGAEIPFGTSLAIAIYAQFPMIIRSVLSVVALYAGADPEGFTFDNPVASNLGYFVDIGAHPALHALAAAVDVFSIWVIVLTGIGFACMSKIKKSTAIAVVFAWYALYILILKVAPAALFG